MVCRYGYDLAVLFNLNCGKKHAVKNQKRIDDSAHYLPRTWRKTNKGKQMHIIKLKIL